MSPPLWLTLAVGALLRLVQIWMPIVGLHSWRQADTAAIARHFAENGMVWWLPQIDWAGAGAGYVEAEFPAYPYLLAGAYRLFGVQEWMGRLLSVVFSLITIWLIVRIGRQLLSAEAGRWGGLLYAIAPLAVYYGRTLQAESLLMLLAALCLDRLLAWRAHARPGDLLLCWLCLCLCGLMKVLPLIWLGLPISWLWPTHSGRCGWRDPWLWALAISATAITAAWYVHAHQVGIASGNSFGFWQGDTNRYSWRLLLDWRYWAELLMRFSLRGLAIIGLPLLLLGAYAIRHQHHAKGLWIGCAAVVLTGSLAPESSRVHEYYQLPLLLYACPLAGQGWQQILLSSHHPKRLLWILMAFITTISLLILSLDYWRVEAQQASALMPLANAIRSSTPPQARIVSVSGADPTLLNLARRQGWLTRPGKVNPEQLERWHNEGATYIAGSFERIESFRLFDDLQKLKSLKSTLCSLRLEHNIADPCHWFTSYYLLPLS